MSVQVDNGSATARRDESTSAEIFEQMTPWLIGLADKLRRALEEPLSEAERAMFLRAAAADVELVWRYLAMCASCGE